MIKHLHLFFDIFDPFENLICRFSTRKGGVSQGIYQSLNLGLHTGDDIRTVKRNRETFLHSLDISSENIAFTDQVHSSFVSVVSQPAIYPRTDALITAEKNIFLAIQTADCFPVFLFDPTREVVAAIHCGWRSVLNNIIENTMQLMSTQFDSQSNQVLAAVGPGLQQECFEIRDDLFNRLEKIYLHDHNDPEKRLFDLKKMIVNKLLMQGISLNNIHASNMCTKCNAEQFYSFRRDGNYSGRMMGIIGMRR